MAVCPACGHENPDAAKFCMECATPLVGLTAPPAHEVRKTVTVVFSDVTGSTAMGEELDPEALRRVMSRYFDEMRAVLERHGGTVEKFIGDAVMAVFGVPRAHEDDALRAVRAAGEMRDTLARLNQELERDRGVTIAARTGVNTGEVVAGTGEHTIATGDAVNVAARLEQVARPGEILIGEDTFRLVRDVVVAEPVEPLKLKGKAEAVTSFRLVRVTPGPVEHVRRLDSPMVGRERESALLRQAFERAVVDHACQMFTVLGPPGVGKSRLIEEFAADIDDATALRGRCLPYGEGITFFPVLEVVKEAAGLADFDAPDVVETKICSVLEGEENQEIVCKRVAQLLGVSDIASPEETFWAIRRMFEAIARERPLVLLFDDIHWGEPTFLDLIEHIANWSRDVAILLVCMARPELLDTRSSWGGGKMNAATITLEPLSDIDCDTLIANLLGAAELHGEIRDRIAEASEGNPLFVEEMLSVLIDDGKLVRTNSHWSAASDLTQVTVPPSITALLTARLDQLADPERTVLEAASVVGKEFFLGAVEELIPDDARADVRAQLMSLVRKEFIRPDRSTLPDEDMFRFRHLMIRDAAYEAMPKSLRADLHEGVAGWIQTVAGGRVAEQEEILGYHLERAHAYLVDLGARDDRSRALGGRASGHLAMAGERAAERGDHSAAGGLLLRAAALRPPDDPSRVELLLAAARSLVEVGDYAAAEGTLSDAAAASAGDRALETEVDLERAFLRGYTDPAATSDFVETVERAIPVLEDAGDEAALARAWWISSWRGPVLGDYDRGEQALRRSMEHARRVGDRKLEREALWALTNLVVWSPVSVADGFARLEEVASLAADDRRVGAHIQNARSALLAMSGDFVGARDSWDQAQTVALDLGLPDLIGFAAQEGWLVETLAGDPDAAERIARGAYEVLARAGNSMQSIVADELSQSLYEQGRLEEAEQMTRLSEEAGMAPDDVYQAAWQLTRGKILARRGEFAEAERLVREGIRLLEPTQFVTDRAFSLLDLAEVLRLAGRPSDAAAAIESAIDLFERKGNVVSAERARRLLDDLHSR
jgi:class 3 adenylate cyclase/tetratricopeptide (TPR) repeat protein